MTSVHTEKGVANDNYNDANIICGVDSSIACARHHKGSACDDRQQADKDTNVLNKTADGKEQVMKPILVPYDENMTKEELLKAIADAVGSDVETVKKELCEPKAEPRTERSE